jgi:signal peptidase II
MLRGEWKTRGGKLRVISFKEKIWILSLVTFTCGVLDQLTKVAAVQWLKGTEPIIFWENLFRLEYAENTGAFLGMGSNLPDWQRYLVLTIFSSAILVGLIAFLLIKKDLSRTDFYGYGFILAGGVSNMIDRIRAGIVIDFLNLGIGDLRTGIFNIADVAIMGGLILVLAAHLRGMGKKPKKTDAPIQGLSA